MSTSADTDALVRYLVTSLVEDAEAVRVERSESDGTVTYEIHTAPDDVGKIIGRQGRIIKAIRTLVRSAGSTTGTSIEVEVVG